MKKQNFLRQSAREDSGRTHAGQSTRVFKEATDGVCKLSLPNSVQGTGFFGGLDCGGSEIHRGLFTCYHVIDANMLRSRSCILSVSNDYSSRNLRVKAYSYVNEALDATFIELTDEQADAMLNCGFRFLRLDYSVKDHDEILVFQHPGNGNLNFSYGKVLQVALSRNFFHHDAETNVGSSGSPVVNRFGDVIGMHCGYDSIFKKNRAVKMEAFRDAVKSDLVQKEPTLRIQVRGSQDFESLRHEARNFTQRGNETRRRPGQFSVTFPQQSDTREPTQTKSAISKAQIFSQWSNDFKKLQADVSSLTSRNTQASNSHGTSMPARSRQQSPERRAPIARVVYPAAQCVTPHDLVFCFGGVPDPCLQQIQIFCPTEKLWYRGPSLLHERCFSAAAVWNNSVIISGGNRDPTDAVERYDPDRNICSPFPKLLHGRWGHAMVNQRGVLYVIGGYSGKWIEGRYDKNFVMSSVEKYEKDGDYYRWQKVLPLQRLRVGLTANTLSDSVLVAGGYDGSSELSSCELYDLELKRWLPIRSMNSKRCYASSATYNNVVFVFGGEIGGEALRDSEQYDKRNDKWTSSKLDQMKVARYSFAAATVGNEVYLLGGHESDRLDSVECFDLNAKKMIRDCEEQLPSPCRGLTGVGITVSNEALLQLTSHPLQRKIKYRPFDTS